MHRENENKQNREPEVRHGDADLAGRHHHVTPARPDEVEDGPVGHPALDDTRPRRPVERGKAGNEGGHAVGEHQIGSKRGLGQPRRDGGQGAEGACQDLPVAAPGLGARDDAQLVKGEVGRHDALPCMNFA